MIETTATRYPIGARVRAFHPRRFGVIDHGTIVGAGPKYARVDFGPMLGGTFRVPWRDIVEAV